MASSLNSLQLLDQKKIACDNQLIVLCIETTSSLPKRRKRTVVEEENEDRSEDEIGEGKTENGKERGDPEALRKNEKDDEEETDFPAYSPVSQPLESTSAQLSDKQQTESHNNLRTQQKPPPLIQDLYLI